MKSKHYITLSLVLALIFSSCGSLSISQRRYSRGINIDWLAYGKAEKPEEKKANVAKKKAGLPTETKNTVANSDNTAGTVQSNENGTVVASESTASTSTQEKKAVKQHVKISPVKKALTIAKEFKEKKQAMNHHANTATTDQSNDSDVNLILLVILAILLPPLAVFLYFGELNIHFWISLILVLLWGGFYASVGIGGIGLAIIHALLVVFGVFG
ncbi:MAG: YqaE/Pmp3 family membrane protein [Bacteroidota bacterium]